MSIEVDILPIADSDDETARLADPIEGVDLQTAVLAHQDVPLILMANAGVVTATRDAAPEAWRRLVGYLIQSFTAEAAQPLPAPPTQRQLYQALMRPSVTPR